MEEEYNKLFEYFDKAEKIELDQKIKEDLQVVLSEKKKKIQIMSLVLLYKIHLKIK